MVISSLFDTFSLMAFTLVGQRGLVINMRKWLQ